MIGIKYRVSLPELDKDKFIKALREACNKALLKAARDFLVAAVPRVHIFTGFARSAFHNLEQLAGRVSDSGKLSIHHKPGTKEILFQKKPYYYYPDGGGRIRRTNISGRPFGTPTENILAQGRARVAENQSAIFFRFSIDINYFDYLDRNKWGAFEEGGKAFDSTFREQLALLKPKLGKYLVRRDILK